MPDMTMMRDLAGRLSPARVAVHMPDGRAELRELEVHPLAMLIPGMSEEDERRLRADIAVNGVQEPLVLFEDKVLDGRHRLRIASQEGAVVRTVPFGGDEAAARAFVWSANVARRHLSVPQLALAADRFGFVAEAKQAGSKTWPRAASRATGGAVTPRSIQRFDQGRVAQAPKTVAKIDAGEIRRIDSAVHEAARELGTEVPPVVHRSAWDRLGCARGDVLAAERAVMTGDRIDPEAFAARAREIQQVMIRVDRLLRARNVS